MKTVLEVIGLNKKYSAFELQDVSFTLQENCITGFIGINGAGKTTTIKAILGLALKDRGSIRLFGKDMDSNERELKNRIAVVFDEGYFYEDLKMSEMKSIIAPAYSNWSDADFKKNMERFNLNANQQISSLSKGMRMKFALVLALAHNADLLIMDEPTSGLDPLIRSEFMEMLKEFVSQEGKSVFFSTHIVSDLEKVADMLILIDRGRIIFNENRDCLLDSYAIAKGDGNFLNDDTRCMFLTLNETKYGFNGLIELKNCAVLPKDIVIERPTVEDIMLGYIGRGGIESV